MLSVFSRFSDRNVTATTTELSHDSKSKMYDLNIMKSLGYEIL